MTSSQNPTYAVLGATGNTGLALLRILLHSPDRQVHAYCRSRDKLARLFPSVNDNANVQVYSGSLDDSELLAECIRGTRAVFLAVAVTDNVPFTTIAQDTAKLTIVALEKVKAEGNSKLPKLVVLSSAGTEHKYEAEAPWLLRTAIAYGCSYIYADLILAEKYLRSHDSWVSTTFIKPGALCQDTQKGHKLSADTAKSPVSFLDLAAGMVEVAEAEGDEYDMRSVSVNPTASDVAIPWGNAILLSTGILYHFFPWTYGWF